MHIEKMDVAVCICNPSVHMVVCICNPTVHMAVCTCNPTVHMVRQVTQPRELT